MVYFWYCHCSPVVCGTASSAIEAQNQRNLARARALGGKIEYDNVAVVAGKSPRTG
tara:strand:+ start:732 stop:899 length:168 start_codon:yes stop_codon:yes gene_type:complete